ncbi:RNA-binding protein 48 isoform X2 [Ambystoma mexicanum]|uniref:RNA-binding protein 48 isoform X2 n=1 Tax=Ambystoma mexicanum TaxID=8296 RepID=UPI0037E7E454
MSRMESQSGVYHQQELQVYGHHAQRASCHSRAKYREGRRPKAVRVYTINLESRYLLVQGVPAIGVMKELVEHFALFGTIEEYHALDEYPAEEFTEVYLIKFQRLHSARVAKRKLDERSFFGGVLHVCYAPEFETVHETRAKLQDRRKFIARATSDKDSLVTRKPDPKLTVSTEDFGQHYDRRTLEFSVPEACPSIGNQYQQKMYPFESMASKSASKSSSVALSQEHLQTALPFPHFATDCTKMNTNCNQPARWMQGMQLGADPINVHSAAQQRVNLPDNGVNRFMPRTTQLQERKRKRDEGNTCSLFGTGTDEEVIVGPLLPEIPKVDMEDESLNVSANSIRSKLKKVSSIFILTPEIKQKDTPVKQPVKPRRRI